MFQPHSGCSSPTLNVPAPLYAGSFNELTAPWNSEVSPSGLHVIPDTEIGSDDSANRAVPKQKEHNYSVGYSVGDNSIIVLLVVVFLYTTIKGPYECIR